MSVGAAPSRLSGEADEQGRGSADIMCLPFLVLEDSSFKQLICQVEQSLGWDVQWSEACEAGPLGAAFRGQVPTCVPGMAGCSAPRGRPSSTRRQRALSGRAAFVKNEPQTQTAVHISAPTP